MAYDPYDYSEHIVGDFATPQEALQIARKQASIPNASPPSLSYIYLVYDDQGTCLDRISYDDARRST